MGLLSRKHSQEPVVGAGRSTPTKLRKAGSSSSHPTLAPSKSFPSLRQHLPHLLEPLPPGLAAASSAASGSSSTSTGLDPPLKIHALFSRSTSFDDFGSDPTSRPSAPGADLRGVPDPRLGGGSLGGRARTGGLSLLGRDEEAALNARRMLKRSESALKEAASEGGEASSCSGTPDLRAVAQGGRTRSDHDDGGDGIFKIIATRTQSETLTNPTDLPGGGTTTSTSSRSNPRLAPLIPAVSIPRPPTPPPPSPEKIVFKKQLGVSGPPRGVVVSTVPTGSSASFDSSPTSTTETWRAAHDIIRRRGESVSIPLGGAASPPPPATTSPPPATQACSPTATTALAPVADPLLGRPAGPVQRKKWDPLAAFSSGITSSPTPASKSSAPSPQTELALLCAAPIESSSTVSPFSNARPATSSEKRSSSMSAFPEDARPVDLSPTVFSSTPVVPPRHPGRVASAPQSTTISPSVPVARLLPGNTPSMSISNAGLRLPSPVSLARAMFSQDVPAASPAPVAYSVAGMGSTFVASPSRTATPGEALGAARRAAAPPSPHSASLQRSDQQQPLSPDSPTTPQSLKSLKSPESHSPNFTKANSKSSLREISGGVALEPSSSEGSNDPFEKPAPILLPCSSKPPRSSKVTVQATSEESMPRGINRLDVTSPSLSRATSPISLPSSPYPVHSRPVSPSMKRRSSPRPAHSRSHPPQAPLPSSSSLPRTSVEQRNTERLTTAPIDVVTLPSSPRAPVLPASPAPQALATAPVVEATSEKEKPRLQVKGNRISMAMAQFEAATIDSEVSQAQAPAKTPRALQLKSSHTRPGSNALTTSPSIISKTHSRMGASPSTSPLSTPSAASPVKPESPLARQPSVAPATTIEPTRIVPPLVAPPTVPPPPPLALYPLTPFPPPRAPPASTPLAPAPPVPAPSALDPSVPSPSDTAPPAAAPKAAKVEREAPRTLSDKATRPVEDDSSAEDNTSSSTSPSTPTSQHGSTESSLMSTSTAAPSSGVPNLQSVKPVEETPQPPSIANSAPGPPPSSYSVPAAVISGNDTSSGISDEPSRHLTMILAAASAPPRSGNVYPIYQHLATPALLRALLAFLPFSVWLNLYSMSRVVRRLFDIDRNLKDAVMERYLAHVGYRKWDTISWGIESLTLTPDDLNAYLRATTIPVEEFAHEAQAVLSGQDKNSAMVPLLRSLTRHFSRVVMRIKLQAAVQVASYTQARRRASSVTCSIRSNRSVNPLSGRSGIEFSSPHFRINHALLLRVFVLSPEGPWLSDESVEACEDELKASGVWPFMKPGDLVWDCAISEDGNIGHLLFDGHYLIDLDFTFSPVGEIPQAINALAYPPSYYHRVIKLASNPLLYLDFTGPMGAELKRTTRLFQDKGPVSSQGRVAAHTISRWMYRSDLVLREIKSVVHKDWAGTLVILSQGTTEAMSDLGRRFEGSAGRTPFRLLRERCKPGEIWIRPVLPEEALRPA